MLQNFELISACSMKKLAWAYQQSHAAQFDANSCILAQ
jgi:hypothetical protein